MKLYNQIISFRNNYALHLLCLVVLIPIIIFACCLVFSIVLLSKIPLIGAYFSTLLRIFQNYIIDILIIPGSTIQFSGIDQTSLIFKGYDSLEIELYGNSTYFPFIKTKNKLILPHVPARYLDDSGFGARINFYTCLVEDIIKLNPEIKKFEFMGMSLGGGILSEVVAKIYKEGGFTDKEVTVKLDRTFDDLANASSGFLRHSVPKFLLKFLYFLLDFNINTKNAINIYSKYDNIKTFVYSSTQDFILLDSSLYYPKCISNLRMMLTHNGHNDFNIEHFEVPHGADIPIHYFRSIFFTLDAAIVLTILECVGVIPNILSYFMLPISSLSVYSIIISFLYHYLVHCCFLVQTLRNSDISSISDSIKFLQTRYLTEIFVFTTLTIITSLLAPHSLPIVAILSLIFSTTILECDNLQNAYFPYAKFVPATLNGVPDPNQNYGTYHKVDKSDDLSNSNSFS
jgi:hypothetical protein